MAIKNLISKLLEHQELSAAETEGRRQVREILAFLRDYVPGAQDVRLLSLPASPQKQSPLQRHCAFLPPVLDGVGPCIPVSFFRGPHLL